jgi:hypothetical protein
MVLHPTREPLALHQVAQLDIAAASGLVLRQNVLWVIADDELSMAGYDRAGERTAAIRLLAGALPEAAAERKARKADFEALLLLPDAALLALGSGSTPNRRRGAWVRVEEGVSRQVDLTPLFQRLERDLPELNIEGGAVLGDSLFLCSRGNGALRQNALVRLAWPECERAIMAASVLPAEALRSVTLVELGELAGHTLGFTDLAVAGDRLLFSAAAEASESTYADGVCVGSAVGLLSPDAALTDLVVLTGRHKIEGIWVTPEGDALSLLMVADPDDRAARAPLFTASYSPR